MNHRKLYRILCFTWICLIHANLFISGQVTRKPYLQVPTPTSMIVRWQTGTGEPGNLFYGLSPSSLTNTVKESDEERIYHEVKITGLKPGTKYYYSVDGGDKGNDEQYFITPPEAGKPAHVRIWVISDFGQTNSDDNQRRTQTVENWSAFNKGSHHASFVLSLGDQSEDDAIYQMQHNYFSQLEKVLVNSPLYTVIGNHDNHDSIFNYQRTFTLPAKGEAGGVASGSRRYYSFDYSNIHVVVLCTETYDSADYNAQVRWLKRDLEHNRQSWLIACMHQPLHSAGYHPTDKSDFAQQRRKDWLKLLEDNGVDLILQGHNHVYERSFLVDNIIGKSSEVLPVNYIDKTLGRPDEGGAYIKSPGCKPHEGTVFVTCTGGGVANQVKYYPSPYSFIPVYFPGSDYEGSVVMDVNDNRMDVKFICDQADAKGSHIWDNFTIIKK